MIDMVVFAAITATICLAIVGLSVIAGNLLERAEYRYDRWVRLREWRRHQRTYQTPTHVTRKDGR